VSVTLREVAESAGVSIGTASQALNNRPGVAQETRLRVLEAATALGYPVKTLGLPQETPIAVVGLLLKHDADDREPVNHFYAYVQSGVEAECRERGLHLMYSNIEVDAQNRPVQWPIMLSEARIDGLLLCGTFIETALDAMRRQRSIPIVMLDAYTTGAQVCDRVLTDNFSGALAATRYLIGNGHRCIGLIGSTAEAYPSIRERREGYLEALRRAGIPDSFIEDSPIGRAPGYEATLRLLQRAPVITAIFACNDDTALGVLKAARDLGRRVPEDLSVMGFDDLVLIHDVSPALTTMHVDKVLMGRLGVRQLLERARNPAMPAVTIMLQTELVVRESVARLKPQVEAL